MELGRVLGTILTIVYRFLALILGPRGLGAPYMELGRTLGTILTIVYRFLALILGPRGLGARYMELGRALGTILTDQVHHTSTLCSESCQK